MQLLVIVFFFFLQPCEIECNTVFTWLELSLIPDNLLSQQNVSGASSGLAHLVAHVFDWKSLKISIYSGLQCIWLNFLSSNFFDFHACSMQSNCYNSENHTVLLHWGYYQQKSQNVSYYIISISCQVLLLDPVSLEFYVSACAAVFLFPSLNIRTLPWLISSLSIPSHGNNLEHFGFHFFQCTLWMR